MTGFIKHQLALTPDDPIFILQTINQRLLRESAEAQKVILDQYKSELESLKNQWGDDVKIKTERILNASLVASKESMTKTMEECANTVALSVHNEIETITQTISDQLRESKQIAKLNLIASTIILISVCIAIS